MKTLLRSLIACSTVMLALTAHAQLTIEVTTQAGKQIPVAISPFVGEVALPQPLTQTISNDLQRTGLFRMVNTAGITPVAEPRQVAYADWAGRQAQAVVIGSTSPRADGKVDIRFHLVDVASQGVLTAFEFSVPPVLTRATAHKIADIVYEKLTGDKGVFSTRIAYVVRRPGRSEIQVADWDGVNPVTVLAQTEPIMSPAWSYDGSKVAYVSFERRKAEIYVQDLATGQRRLLASFRGSASAPTWSPDGSRLAVVLTRDGTSQIYLLNAGGGEPQRITNSGAIDTDPVFSPNGSTIFFTSDRGGAPQIYRMPASGGGAQRVTFEGGYNASPTISPDGKQLAYINREGGRYRVALLELDSQQVNYLTDGPQDDRPSFAPNGRTILYEAGGSRGTLATVSTDGRVKQRLSTSLGNVQAPSWGPFPR